MKESERAILEALTFAKDQKLRWTDLLKETTLCKRSLSTTLKSLKGKQRIQRIVDAEAEEYPPPVYYQLINKPEREFAEKVNREWNEISERTQKLFNLTFKFKTPDIYLEEILKAIMRDCVFTLYHAAFAPNMIEPARLLEWHSRIHRKLMVDTLNNFGTSKKYRETLKQTYQRFRDDLLEEEARIEKA